MIKKTLSILIGAILAFTTLFAAPKPRWSAEKANKWAADKGWIVGCDYVTSNAINQIEMWQAETFSPEIIDRELGYAESIGFNTVRVFFSHLVYLDDPKGFKQRFSQFLDICEKHHIRALPTFWTNGGKCKEPKLGPQPPSRKGVHNSEWCMVPGTEWVNDPTTWPKLEKMVKDILRTYRNDKRILMWCLYNEPENLRRGVKSSIPLMSATFHWAREINPSQPLTAPIWRPVGEKGTSLPEVSFVLENSDVISFHAYKTPEVTERYILTLLPYGRPLVCTEYMARTLGSTFEGCMPVFKKYNVGAINFGLVTGKLNCHYHWNKTDKNGFSIPWDKEPDVWFHDIFREDGTPFSEKEIEFIKSMTGAK